MCKLNEMSCLSKFSCHLADDPQELTGFIRGENLPETQFHDVPETGSPFRQRFGVQPTILEKYATALGK